MCEETVAKPTHQQVYRRVGTPSGDERREEQLSTRALNDRTCQRSREADVSVRVHALDRRFWFFHSALAHSPVELPLSIVEWANVTSLEPSRDAVEVEGVLKKRKKRYEEG
jgi:hypothetical protein